MFFRANISIHIILVYTRYTILYARIADKRRSRESSKVRRPCTEEEDTFMQHIHAKHGIASAIISMLRSLTLSDWAFFFEFQQNSRTATRMARARPQTSTTKTPPGTGKTGSSLFYRRRLSLLLPPSSSRACFTVNVPVTEFHPGSVRPSITL